MVGVRVGGEKVWEFGISRYKPLYMGWISNKILIYSIENHIENPVTNHNGKECYTYKTETLCYTVEIGIAL